MIEATDKRTWVYDNPPRAYDVAPCSCGNEETQWSEYKDHLWCSKCQKDFIPEHWGMFDGPILLNLSAVLGITFDRIDLDTGRIMDFDIDTGEYR